MTANELRQMTDEALREELLDLTREAFNLRVQASTGQLSRFTQMKAVRRDIARVKTIIREREGKQA